MHTEGLNETQEASPRTECSSKHKGRNRKKLTIAEQNKVTVLCSGSLSATIPVHIGVGVGIPALKQTRHALS